MIAADAGTTAWGACEQLVPSGSRTTVEVEYVQGDQRNQWNASTDTIEVTEPGNYLVSTGLWWLDEPSSGTNHWITVRRSGNVGVARSFTEGPDTHQASRPVLGVDSGDAFHVEVEQYEGSALRVGGSRTGTYLSVVQL